MMKKKQNIKKFKIIKINQKKILRCIGPKEFNFLSKSKKKRGCII